VAPAQGLSGRWTGQALNRRPPTLLVEPSESGWNRCAGSSIGPRAEDWQHARRHRPAPQSTFAPGCSRPTFGGSELYPSPAQLAAGETASRALTATLGASAGDVSTALTELAANGKTLTLEFTIKASVAPTLGSISTPGGTFHSPVGVVLSVVSMKPLTGSALLNHTWALLSSTFSQLFTSTVYFAPGVGPVEIAAPGAHLRLESSGCAG
jgi:hypothetical protein